MNQNSQDSGKDGARGFADAPLRPKKPWDWQAAATFAICVSLLMSLTLLPELLRLIGAGRLKELSPAAIMALAALPLQVALLLSALVPAALAGKALAERLWLKAPGLRQIAILLGIEIVLFPSLLAISWAAKTAIEFFKLGTDTQQLVVRQALETSGGGFAVLLASAVVIAPVAEELAFRRALFGFLQGFAGTFPAFVTSSVVFAASHCSIAQFPSLLALGLVLQWTCLRWKSVVPAIMLHSLHNAISMGILLAFRILGINPDAF